MHAPTVLSQGDQQFPRYSTRDRSATSRFQESWFSINLPRLSLALGLGSAVVAKVVFGPYDKIPEAEVEAEAPLLLSPGQPENEDEDEGYSADDEGCLSSTLIGEEECQSLTLIGEEEDHCGYQGAVVGKTMSVLELPRCSERERRPTARFLEGWFGVRLPRLSAALGVGSG